MHAMKQLFTRIFCSRRKYYATLRPTQYTAALREWYYRNTSKLLDLNRPRTFNEKMQWLKLNDSTREKSQLADKVLAKQLIAEKIGASHIVPMLGAWDNANDINFAAFPESFVLKSSHASGWNLIVRDKQKLNHGDARKAIKKWLRTNYAFESGFELHYAPIKPRMVLENYLSNKKGGFVYNYQFFCFHGRPQLIRIGLPDVTGLSPNSPYASFNLDFVQVPNITRSQLLTDLPRNMECLADMAELSRILSRDFIFVRVDFYQMSGEIYVGEMTFTPASGIIKWSDEKSDHYYGEMLTLPIDG